MPRSKEEKAHDLEILRRVVTKHRRQGKLRTIDEILVPKKKLRFKDEDHAFRRVSLALDEVMALI